MTTIGYVERRAPRSFDALKPFLSHHGRGVAATFFLSNPYAGWAFVLATLLLEPVRGLFGLMGALTVDGLGQILRADKSLQGAGIFSLNGWFIGLCLVTFFGKPEELVLAAILSFPLTALFTIVVHRCLAVLNLPVLVLPYTLSFWVCYLFAVQTPLLTPIIVEPAAGFLGGVQIVEGTVTGFAEIFLSADFKLGLAIIFILALFHWRLGLVMFGAALLTMAVATLLQLPSWQLTAGLPVFPAVLMVAAVFAGYRQIPRSAIYWAILTGGMAEAVCLKLGATLGLPALSSSYILLIWLTLLSRGVVEKRQVARDWSGGF